MASPEDSHIRQSCSVACSNTHKPTHANDPPPTPPQSVPVPAPKNPRPGPPNPFAALDDSQELQLLFKQYPRLASQLDAIHTATLPPSEQPSQYQEQEHEHPRRPRRKEPWTHDRGLQDGVAALTRARAPYDEGEGVREFSSLVLRLVGGDESEVIRRELAEENARIIEALLNGEL